jgi:hypothetical protein
VVAVDERGHVTTQKERKNAEIGRKEEGKKESGRVENVKSANNPMHQKPIATQIVKKFLAFCGIQSFLFCSLFRKNFSIVNYIASNDKMIDGL